MLDPRFVPLSAAVQPGAELVTSGLDGIYSPGLPVEKVVRVDKQADTAFARVVCLPIAPVRGARQLLVLHYEVNQPPNPEEVEAAAAAKEAKDNKGKKGKAAPAKSASGAASAAAASAPAAKQPEPPAPVKKTEPAAAKKAEKSEHAKKAEPARKAASGVAP